MARYNEFSVSSDKIVTVVGEKLTTSLNGEKNISEFVVTSDKIVSLNGEKYITNFIVNSNKSITLNGEKNIGDLTGFKFLENNLIGSLDKTSNLRGDGCGIGWWYIMVDSTLFTSDDMYVTVDRTPNF